MKHFNWDCECGSCMIMKAGRDLYEALKEVELVWAGLDQYRKFPHLEEVITKALAKVKK